MLDLIDADHGEMRPGRRQNAGDLVAHVIAEVTAGAVSEDDGGPAGGRRRAFGHGYRHAPLLGVRLGRVDATAVGGREVWRLALLKYGERQERVVFIVAGDVIAAGPLAF